MFMHGATLAIARLSDSEISGQVFSSSVLVGIGHVLVLEKSSSKALGCDPRATSYCEGEIWDRWSLEELEVKLRNKKIIIAIYKKKKRERKGPLFLYHSCLLSHGPFLVLLRFQTPAEPWAPPPAEESISLPLPLFRPLNLFIKFFRFSRSTIW